MKVSRLVSIILILLNKKRIGTNKLAGMFEVSVRTIYRDIETLMIAGVPIHSTSGVGGGFEIMENYKIDKNTFSESDLTTILMGISSIPNIMKNISFIDTQIKIENLIPSHKILETHLKTEQYHIDFSQWTGREDFDAILKS